jgi:hypothetical protein
MGCGAERRTTDKDTDNLATISAPTYLQSCDQGGKISRKVARACLSHQRSNSTQIRRKRCRSLCERSTLSRELCTVCSSQNFLFGVTGGGNG